MTNKVTKPQFRNAILNGNIITIEEAKECIVKGYLNKNTEFSCPNDQCSAPLRFCYNLKQPKREPYFRTANGKKSEHVCKNSSAVNPFTIKKSKIYNNKLKNKQSVVIFNPNLLNDSPAHDSKAYNSAKYTYTSNQKNKNNVILPETDNKTTTTHMSRLFRCIHNNNDIIFKGKKI